MNLGKLLGAGKTFFGGCTMAVYRQNKRVYLPKFNAGHNPFTPARPVEPAPAAVPAAKAVFAPVPARAQLLTTPSAAKPVRAGWTSKLNPFRMPEAAPLLPQAVQPELSLAAVKVVHNDLADADIEIVPVKSRDTAPVLQPARAPLGVLSESFLRPG